MDSRLTAAIADSGLLEGSRSAVVLISGGADSACALAGTAELLGAANVCALHLNYGLRPDSGEDEGACGRIAAQLGVEMRVEHPELAGGNVQAAARDARYAAAERVRAELGAAVVVTGHTRTDLAETVIYRLAASPGRRALLGLAPRRGRVVRPLLGISREQTREIARAAGLPFRDDPTNAEPLYARNRIRAEVLPVLAEIAPATEQTIAATWAELAEEGDALDAVADDALTAMGVGPGVPAIPGAQLAELHPAIARLALRRFAERSLGTQVSLSRARAAEILRLAAGREGGTLELGDGNDAVIEHGHIRIAAAGGTPVPDPVTLPIPGRAGFGDWELRAELAASPAPASGPEVAQLDPGTLGAEVVVRVWEEGDRMRPIGLDGTKSLQDLFVDAKVPRSLRRRLPVVLSGERIAWVAGVAVSEEFRAPPGMSQVAVLHAQHS
jgi:tRNA(Ile)-lysidine synthase